MPIFSIEGQDALHIRRNNEYAAWGSRNEENRVEPVANPAFEVPFRLEPGETIFTIGSCFARNVESELVQRGFRVPMRELLTKPEFRDLPAEIFNNFGTPSIYNEFAWAFGDRQFDEEKNIVEVGNGKFVDLHMVNSIRPAPLEIVQKRRRGLIDATRIMADCRVMIMTLGLVELWWDNETESYLNTGPLPSLLKKHPNRFALHVLSFEECHDYLRKALNIALKNGRADISIILTVSPVPMMATHRNIDVITANSYSKSVLRTVAEQLVAEYPQITYFPSYETVSLSDRRFTWSDDFVHVNPDMIALNVERMVNAFTGTQIATAQILPNLQIETTESAESLLLAEKAREARIAGNGRFLARNAAAADTSPAFALEYAKFLHQTQRHPMVLKVTEKDGRPVMQILRAQALIAIGKPEEAQAILLPLCQAKLKGIDHWRVRTEAAIAMRSEKELLRIEQEWLGLHPRAAHNAQLLVGRGLRKLGEDEKAVSRLAAAAATPGGMAATAIEYADCLLALKRHRKAQQALEGIAGDTKWQATRISDLKRKIRDALG